MASLILRIASSRGSTPEIAKKQVCMIVLMRPAMPASVATAIGVDHVEPDALADEVLLHRARQLVPDLVGTERAVEQEHRAVDRLAQHVDALDELELVAGDEPGALHEVGRADRPRPEAQVRRRARAGLLRVVDEEPLRVARRSPRR